MDRSKLKYLSPEKNFEKSSEFSLYIIYIREFRAVNLTRDIFQNNIIEYIFRIIDCVVSHDEHRVYAMHSFEDDQLCFDKSRNDTSFFRQNPDGLLYSKNLEKFHSKLEKFHSKLENFHSILENFHSNLEKFHSKLEKFHSKLRKFHSNFVKIIRLFSIP